MDGQLGWVSDTAMAVFSGGSIVDQANFHSMLNAAHLQTEFRHESKVPLVVANKWEGNQTHKQGKVGSFWLVLHESTHAFDVWDEFTMRPIVEACLKAAVNPKIASVLLHLHERPTTSGTEGRYLRCQAIGTRHEVEDLGKVIDKARDPSNRVFRTRVYEPTGQSV